MPEAPEAPHAVVSTGAETTELPGGRSRYTANQVPILEVRDEVVAKLAEGQRDLLAPEQDTVYLQGHVVLMHTSSERNHGAPDVVTFNIGGETLDEAAKSCIGAFENSYSSSPPSWVASSHDDLAEAIADHYGTCPVRGMEEDLKP